MEKMLINEIIRRNKRGLVREIVGAVLLTIGLTAGFAAVATNPPPAPHAAAAALTPLVG